MRDGSTYNTRHTWLRLTWALQVATSPACILLATTALLTSNLGWLTIDALLGLEQDVSSTPTKISTLPFIQDALATYLGVEGTKVPLDPIVGVTHQIASPFIQLFRTNLAWTSLARNVTGGILNVVVWSVFGLAIVRMSAHECGQQRRIPLRQALDFALRKWFQVAGAPSAAILAIMLLAIPVFSISWLIRFDAGVFVVGIAWSVVLAIAALMTVLALGLAFGWPLMWGAIATEDSDLFDAVSRSYAYTFQRPGHLMIYLLLASLLGLFSWAIACIAAETVIEMAYWSIQVGGGAEQTTVVKAAIENRGAAANSTGQFFSAGILMIRALNNIPPLVASAFSYSFFWSSVGAIYLLLRYDTDGTAFAEIVSRPPVRSEVNDELTSSDDNAPPNS